MSALLPDEYADIQITEEPSKTWKLDLVAGRIKGMVDGLEAIVQAATMAILTPRYRTLIFSWQYGSELETLIGSDKDYAFSEGKRMVRDALSADSRILGVRDFEVREGALYFTIDTIYGSHEMGTEVSI